METEMFNAFSSERKQELNNAMDTLQSIMIKNGYERRDFLILKELIMSVSMILVSAATLEMLTTHYGHYQSKNAALIMMRYFTNAAKYIYKMLDEFGIKPGQFFLPDSNEAILAYADRCIAALEKGE